MSSTAVAEPLQTAVADPVQTSTVAEPIQTAVPESIETPERAEPVQTTAVALPFQTTAVAEPVQTTAVAEPTFMTAGDYFREMFRPPCKYKIYDIHYFRSYRQWTDTYKQNNAALKWFREKTEERGLRCGCVRNW